MSLFYTHLLVPSVSDFRPTADAICQFVGQLIDAAHVASDHTMAYSRVTKCEGRTRQVWNAFTGETRLIPWRSRQLSKPHYVPDVGSLVALLDGVAEYDVGETTSDSFLIRYAKSDGRVFRLAESSRAIRSDNKGWRAAFLFDSS